MNSSIKKTDDAIKILHRRFVGTDPEKEKLLKEFRDQVIEIEFPWKLVSPNVQMHWAKKHARNKKLKLILYLELRKLAKAPNLPVNVTLYRIGPRTLDYVNFISSVKFLQDCIASWIIPGLQPGQADGDSRIQWKYEQIKEPEYKAKIVIEEI